MTTTTPTTTKTRPSVRTTSTTITAGGSLAWLAWVWALALLVFLVLMVGGELRDATHDDSLWQGMGAGWQRWVLLAAGVTMVPTFGPMLISNGVTRATLSTAATTTMAVLAVAGAAVVVIGYAVEDAFYARNDWLHVAGAEDVPAGGLRFAAEVWLHNALGLAAYFASGWLIGAAYYRLGKDVAWLLILPGLVPAAAAEVLLDSRTGGFGFGFVVDGLDAIGQPHAAIGLPATVAVVALACTIARRVTIDTPLRG
jgi:hypothetical protein